MGIELIHADSEFRELEEITAFTRFDAQLSVERQEDNDWMIELPEKVWKNLPVEKGHYIYIPGTEWGGPAERISHIGKDGAIRVYGTCWRGMLSRKAISPPSGQTHLTITSTEANSAVRSLQDGWKSGLFSVSGNDSGLICSASIRYRTLAEAVYNILGTAGALVIVFSDGTAELECMPVRDLSDSVELTGEYNAVITSDSSSRIYNHIIALGRGEMLDRTVLQLWMLPNGTVTSDPSAEGIPSPSELSTLLYDYPAVESEDELRIAAVKKLKSAGGSDSLYLEIKAYDTSLRLGDIVSVRDTLTGMSSKLSITGMELKITSDGPVLTYKSGIQS